MRCHGNDFMYVGAYPKQALLEREQTLLSNDSPFSWHICDNDVIWQSIATRDSCCPVTCIAVGRQAEVNFISYFLKMIQLRNVSPMNTTFVSWVCFRLSVESKLISCCLQRIDKSVLCYMRRWRNSLSPLRWRPDRLGSFRKTPFNEMMYWCWCGREARTDGGVLIRRVRRRDCSDCFL